MKRFKIVRHYFSAGIRRRVIRTGLTLDQVKAHCNDPETSSRTCTKAVGCRRTRQLGPWFDGYEED
jgi:hypothetical protein